MSSSIDSGAGLVLYMIHLRPSIEQRKQFGCGVTIMNGRLLTNHLHGKAAELCLATSWNNRVATTKYIKYINSIYSIVLLLSHGVGKVLL